MKYFVDLAQNVMDECHAVKYKAKLRVA